MNGSRSVEIKQKMQQPMEGTTVKKLPYLLAMKLWVDDVFWNKNGKQTTQGTNLTVKEVLFGVFFLACVMLDYKVFVKNSVNSFPTNST